MPSLLIAGMPRHPDDYQVLTGSFLPRPRTRKLIGMLSVIAASVAVIMLGYLAVGFAGYLAFPAEVASNILNSFASQDHLMLVSCPNQAPHDHACCRGMHSQQRTVCGASACEHMLSRHGNTLRCCMADCTCMARLAYLPAQTLHLAWRAAWPPSIQTSSCSRRPLCSTLDSCGQDTCLHTVQLFQRYDPKPWTLRHLQPATSNQSDASTAEKAHHRLYESLPPDHTLMHTGCR